MVTHVVFDFDETLVASRDVVLRLYNEVAERHGYVLLTPENFEELRHLSILERCKRMGFPPYRLPWMVDPEARLREAGPDSLAARPADVSEWVARLG